MSTPKIELEHTTIKQDATVRLEAVTTATTRAKSAEHYFEWAVRRVGSHGHGRPGRLIDGDQAVAFWTAEDVHPGVFRVTLRVDDDAAEPADLVVDPRPLGVDDQPVKVSLRRSDIVETEDLPLWEVIRQSTQALSFNRYKAFIDHVLCRGDIPENVPGAQQAKWTEARDELNPGGGGGRHPCSIALPYPDIKAYKLLKCATESFMLMNCSSVPLADIRFDHLDDTQREERGLPDAEQLRRLFQRYLVDIPAGDRRVVGLVAALEKDSKLKSHAGPIKELMATNGFNVDTSRVATLPYLAAVRENFPEVPLTLAASVRNDADLCYAVLREKFTNPCLLELIWSYWHEEGMLVQTMNAISLRFQNRRGPHDPDPLTMLAINPLRPLSNLLWGYIQDEQHRLTLARRVYEYRNEYGVGLVGQAVPQIHAAETRSRFLETFHNLLHRAAMFYKEDDDTTIVADPFPVLNALRDVHLVLSEGATNQFDDLRWTARQEMLMQQWLLARDEFRDFLPTRPMTAYPEAWMGRVDAMKSLQGWTDVSVRYFRDLATFGEQIVLAVRFGNWSNVTDREQAGNWARAWRQEVQWYVHAYQAVTGVDLSAEMTDVRQAEQARARALPPRCTCSDASSSSAGRGTAARCATPSNRRTDNGCRPMPRARLHVRPVPRSRASERIAGAVGAADDGSARGARGPARGEHRRRRPGEVAAVRRGDRRDVDPAPVLGPVRDPRR